MSAETKRIHSSRDYVNDVCENVLSSKMDASSLNDGMIETSKQQNNCDGSDSGLDMAITVQLSHNCQDATVNIIDGFVAVNGVFKSAEVSNDLNMSCNSSLVSYDSEIYDCKGKRFQNYRATNQYEYCSDNGSESSSIKGTISSTAFRRSSNVKKKVAMFEPALKEGNTEDSKNASPSQIKWRNTQLQRAVSLPRSTQPTSLRLPRERNLEKYQNNMRKTNLSLAAPTFSSPFATPKGTTPINIKTQKPDSLPNNLNRKHSVSMQRLIQRTPSISRARTPGTPSDDGRWPSVPQSRQPQHRRGMSVTPDLSALKMRSSLFTSTIETPKNSPCNTVSSIYSTLPRRHKQQSNEDISSARGSSSNSVTTESRMSSSVILNPRKNLMSSYSLYANNTPNQNPPAKTTKIFTGERKSLQCSNFQTQTKRTKIYHETSSQTALTNEDLERVFIGHITSVSSTNLIEKRDQETQSDIRDKVLESINEEMRQLKKREQDLVIKLQRENEEKQAMQRELTVNTKRVLEMLEMARFIGCSTGSLPSEDGGSHDSLLMLESQIQISGHELIEKHKEIANLRKLCFSLQLEIERSIATRKNLLEEKIAIEEESNELQDFLQHEKAALCDALKDMEVELQNCKQLLKNRDEETKVLRDECRHLVRLNEQRRQENRIWQTKYSALEAKSKDFIIQQNNSTAGASNALSGLHTRLDNLVDQLIFSYNISDNDLEDLGFQSLETNSFNGNEFDINDAETLMHRKAVVPNALEILGKDTQKQIPHLKIDGSLSPQRNQSFITAVISAIKNATTHSGKKISVQHNANICGKRKNSNAQNNPQTIDTQVNSLNGDDSDSTEMLDSETEPCLMMDNVLEDVVQPDSHSHNMVSSCLGMISQVEIPSEITNVMNVDNSLQNLSQAIATRQQIEMEVHALNAPKRSVSINQGSVTEDLTSCHDSLAEMPSLIEYSTTQAVIDQVIEVDNVITKLLKVLRLIQLDNDHCIQQLIVDKNKLQETKEDILEKMKDLENLNIKLQDELMDATQDLMLKNSDLTNTKAEIQRHRNEIDHLTEDICTLSTLCSNYKKLSPLTEFPARSFSSINPGSSSGGCQQLLPLLTQSPVNMDIQRILSLLEIWNEEGQLKDSRIIMFLNKVQTEQVGFYQNTKEKFRSKNNNNERLQIYANQLENIYKILIEHKNLEEQFPIIKKMRHEIETVRINANWNQIIEASCQNPSTTNTSTLSNESNSRIDFNANGT